MMASRRSRRSEEIGKWGNDIERWPPAKGSLCPIEKCYAFTHWTLSIATTNVNSTTLRFEFATTELLVGVLNYSWGPARRNVPIFVKFLKIRLTTRLQWSWLWNFPTRIECEAPIIITASLSQDWKTLSACWDNIERIVQNSVLYSKATNLQLNKWMPRIFFYCLKTLSPHSPFASNIFGLFRFKWLPHMGKVVTNFFLDLISLSSGITFVKSQA